MQSKIKLIVLVIDLLYIPVVFYFIAISAIDIHNNNTVNVIFCYKPFVIANIILGFTLCFTSFIVFIYHIRGVELGSLRAYWISFAWGSTFTLGLILFITAIYYFTVVYHSPDLEYDSCYVFQPYIIILALFTIIEVVYRMIAIYNKQEFWQNDDNKIDSSNNNYNRNKMPLKMKYIVFVLDLLYIIVVSYIITISSIDIRNGNTTNTLYCQKPFAIVNVIIGFFLLITPFIIIRYRENPPIVGAYTKRDLWLALSCSTTVCSGLILFIGGIYYLVTNSTDPNNVYCYFYKPWVICFLLLPLIEVIYVMIATYNKQEFWQDNGNKIDSSNNNYNKKWH